VRFSQIEVRGVCLAASPALTPAPSHPGDTWSTCAPSILAYDAVEGHLIAWLNRVLRGGLCSTRTLRVTLPSGTVRLGDALLDDLLPGLHLVLHGAGRTTLDLERHEPVDLYGMDVRVEFSQMSIVNVRRFAPPSARLPIRCLCAVAVLTRLAQGTGVVSIVGGIVSVAFDGCTLSDMQTVCSSRPRRFATSG
jgi:hypothetical protein